MEIENLSSSIDVSELFESIKKLWEQKVCAGVDLGFHFKQIVFAVFLNQIKESEKHLKIWGTAKNEIINCLEQLNPIENMNTFKKNFLKKLKTFYEHYKINNDLAQSIKLEVIRIFPQDENWYVQKIYSNFSDQLSDNFRDKMINFFLNLKEKWDHLIKIFNNNKNKTPVTNKNNKVFH
jgi:hypothetical protein